MVICLGASRSINIRSLMPTTNTFIKIVVSGHKLTWVIQPASEASGLAEGQRARFAREAATRFYPPPTPSGAVGHNPKSGSGQFLGRTSLEMRFTRVGVKSKIGHTTRVDAYVCLTLHAGRVKRVKCVKRAILGKIRELHFLGEAPLNSP